ncbi:hypothetical protein [Nocardioides gilvus]|uniref:hypothetical protein n=1 Tax=Nocardioides gilvus TaxID=1735589 RepID=UPI000D74B90E|nr:hypothetical protein [Nocardioides gilvus]
MHDIALTHRWVADAAAARRASRAWLGHIVRDRRLWVAGVVVELGVFGWYMWEFSDLVLPLRVAFCLVAALVMTLTIFGIVLGGTYVLSRVRLRTVLAPGVVLESGFGDGSVAMRSPDAESILSTSGIVRVATHREWVFVTHKGSALSIWPAELFPPAEVSRVRREIASR